MNNSWMRISVCLPDPLSNSPPRTFFSFETRIIFTFQWAVLRWDTTFFEVWWPLRGSLFWWEIALLLCFPKMRFFRWICWSFLNLNEGSDSEANNSTKQLSFVRSVLRESPFPLRVRPFPFASSQRWFTAEPFIDKLCRRPNDFAKESVL
jgi:hypothetical protein